MLLERLAAGGGKAASTSSTNRPAREVRQHGRLSRGERLWSSNSRSSSRSTPMPMWRILWEPRELSSERGKPMRKPWPMSAPPSASTWSRLDKTRWSPKRQSSRRSWRRPASSSDAPVPRRCTHRKGQTSPRHPRLLGCPRRESHLHGSAEPRWHPHSSDHAEPPHPESVNASYHPHPGADPSRGFSSRVRAVVGKGAP